MIIDRLKFPRCLFGYQFYSDKINALLIVTLWTLMAAAVNPIGEFPLNDDWVYSLSFDPHHQNIFISGSGDKTIKFWNTSKLL